MRLICTLVLAAVLPCDAQQRVRAAGQTDSAAVLASSELAYSESGGFAGRHVHARLVAIAGRVTVEYRPAAPPVPMDLTGTMEGEHYLKLWGDAEGAGIWTMTSTPKTRGADLVQHTLTVRLGTKTHVVRWDDGAPTPGGIGRVSELGRRILAAAREATTER